MAWDPAIFFYLMNHERERESTLQKKRDRILAGFIWWSNSCSLVRCTVAASTFLGCQHAHLISQERLMPLGERLVTCWRQSSLPFLGESEDDLMWSYCGALLRMVISRAQNLDPVSCGAWWWPTAHFFRARDLTKISLPLWRENSTT